MFTVGQSSEVSFQVNVMGTSAEPEVSVVLGAVPELLFKANRVGDDWVSSVLIPGYIEPGEYDLRVQVLLNNRMFTPVRKSVSVQMATSATEPSIGITSTIDQIKSSEVRTEEPTSKSSASIFGDTIRNDVELNRASAETKIRLIMPKVHEKVHAKLPTAPVRESIPAELSALAAKAQSPKKVFKPIKTDLPTGVFESQPIRLNMAQIDEAAVSASKLQSKPVKVLKSTGSTRVKLVKESLFYE